MVLHHEIKMEIEGDRFEIDKITIGNEKYHLLLENMGGHLFLQFKQGEVTVHEIIINAEGIINKRCIRRPLHDHDDAEFLLPSLEWKPLKWNEVEEAVLKIPFGMRSSTSRRDE